MENHLSFILREEGGYIKHILNWKESTSNMIDKHYWATEMNGNVKIYNLALNFRWFFI